MSSSIVEKSFTKAPNQINLGVKGMTCASCVRRVERAIGKLPDDSLLARLHDDLASNVLISDLDDPEA
ncbi:MAG: heavy metal-associated domain-containing protein [Gemmatimonadota bacterium]